MNMNKSVVLENGYICPNTELCFPLPQWKYFVAKSYQQLPIKITKTNSLYIDNNHNQSDIANYGHHIQMRPLRQWN